MIFYLYDTEYGDLYRVRAAHRTAAYRKVADYKEQTLEQALDQLVCKARDQVTSL